MPTPNARALNYEAKANDTHTAKPVAARESRPKRARAKAALNSAQAASVKPAAAARVTSAALVRAKKNTSPLLIGAGIGAAVALSAVALRRREKQPTVALFASPNSTFFKAVIKTVAFAVAQSAAKGSLTSLVARALGKAVA